jgi:hypothetical protein
VDYFSDRYLMACVDWAMGKWPIDKAKIAVHAPTHFAIRHPDVFRVLYIGAFEFDVDRKWNPGAGALLTMFGPQEMATTTDGKKAWDIIDIAWYMAQDVGRDIPFMVGLFDQPKDGNHGAEFGWQDDPKGYAALQKFRQPHCAQWGGASISPTLRKHLADMRWDKSVPAFTGCSLDNNPGNGDPDDGDMWGQINGYLFWDYDSIVDKPDAWEMTILLTPDCPQKACTVNITPRWCAAFKCKEGRKLKWTNTGADGKVIQSNTVPADKFGLATLANVVVTKGKNRIAIAAE